MQCVVLLYGFCFVGNDGRRSNLTSLVQHSMSNMIIMT